MADIHPKHPKCECGKALFRAPARGMKRQSREYVFCRNAECESPARALALRSLGAVDVPHPPGDDPAQTGEDPRDGDSGSDPGICSAAESRSDHETSQVVAATPRASALEELRECVRELLPKVPETRHLWVAIALQEVGQARLADEFIKAVQLDALIPGNQENYSRVTSLT